MSEDKKTGNPHIHTLVHYASHPLGYEVYGCSDEQEADCDYIEYRRGNIFYCWVCFPPNSHHVGLTCEIPLGCVCGRRNCK